MAKLRHSAYVCAFNETIHHLPTDDAYKLRLCAMSELTNSILLVEDALANQFSIQELADSIEELIKYAKQYFKPNSAIDFEIAYTHCVQFSAAIKDNILGCQPKNIMIPNGRIIAWGVLGKKAAVLLPFLKGTDLEPDELWDAAGDGVAAKKPDLNSLTADDLVLVLPAFSGGIEDAIKTTKCEHILFFNEIITHLAASVFPEFYNGMVCFEP